MYFTARNLCDFQGLSILFFFMSSFYWVFLYMRNIEQAIVCEKYERATDSALFSTLSITLTQVLILLLAFLPAFTGSFYPMYPNKDQECYILYTGEHDSGPRNATQKALGTMERTITFLVPYPVLVAYQVYCVVRLRRKLFAESTHSARLGLYVDDAERRYYSRILIFYPSSLIVLWLPTYLIRLFETVNLDLGSNNTQFGELSLCMISLEGLVNSLVYGLDLRSLCRCPLLRRAKPPADADAAPEPLARNNIQTLVGQSYEERSASLSSADFARPESEEDEYCFQTPSQT